MLTWVTRVKLAAFAVVGVFVLAYIGQNYADLGPLFGIRDYYTIKVDLPVAGGLFPGSSVTYRGVEIGKVSALDLTGSGGVRAVVHIKHGNPPISARLHAVVSDRSAVGEQYLDLRPDAEFGPYLHPGSTVPANVTSTPAPVTDTLQAVDTLSASVPLQSLRVVVAELGTAFAGQGPDLRAVLTNSTQFTQAAHDNLAETITLIDNSNAVLATQNVEAGAFRDFAHSAVLLNSQLASSDGDLRALIAAAPSAATSLTDLLDRLDPGLPRLLANLTTVSRIGVGRVPALTELLNDIPQLGALGITVTAGGSLRMGLVNTFFNPLPCITGYGGTLYRNGLDLSPAPPLNQSAGCTLSPLTGVDVRGPQNAPHGPSVTPAQPPAKDR